MREAYYVGVIDPNGEVRYVTGYGLSFCAEWEDGKPALRLPSFTADGIMHIIETQGIRAFVIRANRELTLKNPG